MKGIISNADSYVFESNHDVQMLRMGRYPWNIKRRILSDVGHVCNEDAAIAMSEVIGDRTKHIYLAHLSLDNNMKDLARMSVGQTLESRGIRRNSLFLSVASVHLLDFHNHIPQASFLSERIPLNPS